MIYTFPPKYYILKSIKFSLQCRSVFRYIQYTSHFHIRQMEITGHMEYEMILENWEII